MQYLTIIGAIIAGLAYVLSILLLGWELYQAKFRATDRILVLLALVILPVLLIYALRMFEGSKLVSVKLLEALELTFKDRLENVEEKVETQKQHIEKQIEAQLVGKLSTAEQTLYPLIGGPNIYASERLANGKVIIGSKDFAANIVVAELLAQWLQMHCIQVERRFLNGGTITNYACLINDWIDVFVDYTGTGCLFMNIPYRGKTTDQVLKELNRISLPRYGFEWLKPIGTKTDYCLVMSAAGSEERGIKTISELAQKYRGRLTFCGNYEFMNRRDGLLGLKEYYNLRFAEEAVCNYQERYYLVKDAKKDVSVGFTSDSQIEDYNLVILDDDKKFFPDYLETPIARNEALEKIPELHGILDGFSQLGISEADLTALIQDYSDNPESLITRAQITLENLKDT